MSVCGEHRGKVEEETRLLEERGCLRYLLRTLLALLIRTILSKRNSSEAQMR